MSVIELTQSRLLSELNLARKESDRFFNILTAEAIYERPISQRHRVIFYIGHLDSFDSIQICREALGLSSPDPQLDQLFQAGIDPDSSNLPTDTPADWPSLDQVTAYARRCRQRVDETLGQVPDQMIQLIIEHREMHLETLAYMFHNFDYRLKRRPLEQTSGIQIPGNLVQPPKAAEWCEIPAGAVTLGQYRDAFGWDNEFEQHQQLLPAFRIARHSVTNGDYLRFVEQGAQMPNFWTERNGRLFLRGMFELIPLPLDWPVYTTQQEAASYAAWMGKSLPGEAQFHRAAYGVADGSELDYPWGAESPKQTPGNFDFRRWDPESAFEADSPASPFGVRQLVGNGWQWTNTVFAPFPGFQPHATYPGYSANFFDGQHFVMKGGSPRTSSRLLRRSFRNWFRPDYPYVYSTFRCVEN